MTSSQEFESFVPVYDVVPEEWKDARPMLVENNKKMTEGINVRTIGFLLDQELDSGQQFIPGSANNQLYRSVLRKVIDVSPLVAGANAGVDHGILFDQNFTLIDLWVAGTDSNTFTARDISGNDVVMNATQVVITSPQAFDRAFAFIEYIQER